MNKALPIVEALYLGYSFIFWFDNTTNDSIYAKNALYIGEINKSFEGK